MPYFVSKLNFASRLNIDMVWACAQHNLYLLELVTLTFAKTFRNMKINKFQYLFKERLQIIMINNFIPGETVWTLKYREYG